MSLTQVVSHHCEQKIFINSRGSVTIYIEKYRILQTLHKTNHKDNGEEQDGYKDHKSDIYLTRFIRNEPKETDEKNTSVQRNCHNMERHKRTYKTYRMYKNNKKKE